MNLSLAFITGRDDHKLEWLLESLDRQARTPDAIHLIVIDALLAHDSNRTLAIASASSCAWLRGVTYTAPKPNIWQGAQRVTSCDWWAMSNARNTALVVCPSAYDYIAFVDDRCRLGPRWLEAVRASCQHRQSALAGAYTKLEGVPDAPGGVHVSRDHRLGRYPDGKINCGGGWMFGCSMAFPLSWALEVNGWEEGCDGLSGEDYIFGLMLANRGRRIDYSVDMLVEQDRTRGNESMGMESSNNHASVNKGSSGQTYRRTDKGKSPHDKSHAALDRFGKRTRTELTPDLVALRKRYHAGAGFPNVNDGTVGEHRDWYDGQLISEMT